jgi:hypothetical protein
VGICSGFFVVPLDALLQRQGEDAGGVGSAIAIQNFFEHLSCSRWRADMPPALTLMRPRTTNSARQH